MLAYSNASFPAYGVEWSYKEQSSLCFILPVNSWAMIFHTPLTAGIPTIAPPGVFSIDTGAVIGGSTAGVIPILILLVGCFIYNKRRKRNYSTVYMRYMLWRRLLFM